MEQLKLHLLLHGVTLCFTYTVDDDNPQTGAGGTLGYNIQLCNIYIYNIHLYGSVSKYD